MRPQELLDDTHNTRTHYKECRNAYLHDRSLVTATITVVGSWEQRQHTVGMLPLKALHDKLMSAHDKLQVVVVVECLCDVLPKRVSRATWRDSPPVSIRKKHTTTDALHVQPQTHDITMQVIARTSCSLSSTIRTNKKKRCEFQPYLYNTSSTTNINQATKK